MIDLFHTAVRQHLAEDGALAGQVTGLYDRPPPEAVLPFAVIGPVAREDLSTKTHVGGQMRLQLTLFDRGPALGPVRRLADRVAERLTLWPTLPAPYALAAFALVQTDLLFDPDSVTAQAVLRIEARIYAAD